MAVTLTLLMVLLSLVGCQGASVRPGCEALAQALDELWDVMPDTEPPNIIHLFVTKDIIASKFRDLRFGGPDGTIATVEGRHRVACLLAGVQTVDDIAALFTLLPEGVARNAYENVKDFWHAHNGIRGFEDLAELSSLLKYIFRITGFPNFPLDLYDADMGLYLLNRIEEHRDGLLLVDIRQPAPQHLKVRFAKALMSKSRPQFQREMGMPPHSTIDIQLATYVNAYNDAVQKGVKVLQILNKMGLFDLQE